MRRAGYQKVLFEPCEYWRDLIKVASFQDPCDHIWDKPASSVAHLELESVSDLSKKRI